MFIILLVIGVLVLMNCMSLGGGGSLSESEVIYKPYVPKVAEAYKVYRFLNNNSRLLNVVDDLVIKESEVKKIVDDFRNQFELNADTTSLREAVYEKFVSKPLQEIGSLAPAGAPAPPPTPATPPAPALATPPAPALATPPAPASSSGFPGIYSKQNDAGETYTAIGIKGNDKEAIKRKLDAHLKKVHSVADLKNIPHKNLYRLLLNYELGRKTENDLMTNPNLYRWDEKTKKMGDREILSIIKSFIDTRRGSEILPFPRTKDLDGVKNGGSDIRESAREMDKKRRAALHGGSLIDHMLSRLVDTLLMSWAIIDKKELTLNEQLEYDYMRSYSPPPGITSTLGKETKEQSLKQRKINQTLTNPNASNQEINTELNRILDALKAKQSVSPPSP